MPKLKRETYVITRAWFETAVLTMQEQVNRKSIDPKVFQPVADELRRLRNAWLNEQAGDGNV